MLSQNKYRQTAAAAQAVVGLYAPELVVDGKWGSYSQQTYDKLTDIEKTHVQNVISAIAPGNSVKTLREYRLSEKKEAIADNKPGTFMLTDARYVSTKAMRDIISRVSGITGVPSDVLMRFLDLEAARKVVKGDTYYDALAVNNGGYCGLFQFDGKGAAWTQAAKFSSLLPAWSKEIWKDPYYNTLAAACYLRINSLSINKFGYKGPITSNIAYLMHNQGAMGAYKIISGKMGPDGKQSGPALTVAKAAIAEARAFA